MPAPEAGRGDGRPASTRIRDGEPVATPPIRGRFLLLMPSAALTVEWAPFHDINGNNGDRGRGRNPMVGIRWASSLGSEASHRSAVRIRCLS